jgi:hypothetical protein
VAQDRVLRVTRTGISAGWCAVSVIPRWADPQPRSSGSADELANIHAYVACDGAKKRRRDVSALVERNRRYAAIRMSIPAVRTTLAKLNESETGQDGGDYRGFRTGTSPIL